MEGDLQDVMTHGDFSYLFSTRKWVTEVSPPMLTPVVSRVARPASSGSRAHGAVPEAQWSFVRTVMGGFPQMGVPLNHPFLDWIFPIQLLAYPHFRTPPCGFG